MRKGNINHIEAYKQFYKIWIAEKPLGMGAAYFSKLIFFCEPSHKGYIMDQWTSKSINMLTNEPIVHLISNHVSNKNTDITYSTFCNTVDNIAQTLGYKGEEIEIAMFSKGVITSYSIHYTKLYDLHFGKEVSLKIYDRHEIAAGQSRYQIVSQPQFKRQSPLAHDRRGDVMPYNFV